MQFGNKNVQPNLISSGLACITVQEWTRMGIKNEQFGELNNQWNA